MNRLRTCPRRHPGRRGFSLLELTIVIAVILVLVAIVLAVVARVYGQNEERSTRNVLLQLDAALEEWERQVDRQVTFANSAAEQAITGSNWDVPFNPDLGLLWTPPPPASEGQLPAPYNTSLPVQRSVWLVELISQQPNAREIIAKIPATSLRQITKLQGSNVITFPVKDVVDAWGNPIYAVFPGRLWQQGDAGTADLDATIRSVAEDGSTPATSGWGICRNRRVLFVSGGADGSVTDVAATGSIDERADNLYSYGWESQ